jgi:hypothetical protein
MQLGIEGQLCGVGSGVGDDGSSNVGEAISYEKTNDNMIVNLT